MIWGYILLLMLCPLFIIFELIFIIGDDSEFDCTFCKVIAIIMAILFVCVFLKSVTMITYITNPEKRRIAYYQIEEYAQEMSQEQPELESYLSEFLNRLQTIGEENE